MVRATRAVTVRFENNLVDAIEDYVKGCHMTKTDFIREAVLEKLEDMYDMAKADKTYQEWVNGGRKTISHDEMMKGYG